MANRVVNRRVEVQRVAPPHALQDEAHLESAVARRVACEVVLVRIEISIERRFVRELR
jgi:hypothetical protein